MIIVDHTFCLSPPETSVAMSGQDKLRIRQLDEKSDYSLWRIRLSPAVSAKGLDYVMTRKVDDEEASREQDEPVDSSVDTDIVRKRRPAT